MTAQAMVVLFALGLAAPDAVVSVRGSDGGQPTSAATSGFFCDARGYVFTAYAPFVDPGPRRLCSSFSVVAGDGHTYGARAWNVYPLLNLIVLVIDGDSAADFPVLDLTSRRPLQVGDHLTALVRATDGSTVRIPGSVTARSRNTLYGKGLDDLVTDVQMALPAHGFGAPLLDEQERVVGLCLPPPITASPAELAEKEVHALPAMLVRNVQKMIMAFPTFEQPWLGLATQRSGGDGLEVAFVWEGGPAAHVDIQVGDRLREAAGEQLTSTTNLQRLLAKIGEGRDLDLELERAGQVLRRTIRIERRPPWAAPWIESGDQP